LNIGNNKKGVHVKSKLISVLNRLSKEDADEEILEPLTTTDVIEGDEQEDSAVEDERDIEAATQHVNDSGEAVDDLITNVEIVESAGTEVTTEMMNDLKISYITACNISGCQLKKSIMSVESFDSFSNEDFRDTVLTIIRNIKEFIKAIIIKIKMWWAKILIVTQIDVKKAQSIEDEIKAKFQEFNLKNTGKNFVSEVGDDYVANLKNGGIFVNTNTLKNIYKSVSAIEFFNPVNSKCVFDIYEEYIDIVDNLRAIGIETKDFQGFNSIRIGGNFDKFGQKKINAKDVKGDIDPKLPDIDPHSSGSGQYLIWCKGQYFGVITIDRNEETNIAWRVTYSKHRVIDLVENHGSNITYSRRDGAMESSDETIKLIRKFDLGTLVKMSAAISKSSEAMKHIFKEYEPLDADFDKVLKELEAANKVDKTDTEATRKLRELQKMISIKNELVVDIILSCIYTNKAVLRILALANKSLDRQAESKK